MISTVQDQQPKSAGPLILNDSSCIMEAILFSLLTEGCLKVAHEAIEAASLVVIYQTVSILFGLELIEAICDHY